MEMERVEEEVEIEEGERLVSVNPTLQPFGFSQLD